MTVSGCAPPGCPLFACSVDSVLDINTKAICWVVILGLGHAFGGIKACKIVD